MRKAPGAARPNTFAPFRAAGYTNAAYVLGLTEIGTLIMLLQSNPELVSPSLSSLASPGEEKLYRKAALTRLVAETMEVAVEFDEIGPPAQPTSVLDRTSLWTCWLSTPCPGARTRPHSDSCATSHPRW